MADTDLEATQLQEVWVPERMWAAGWLSPTRSTQLEGLAFRQRWTWDPWGGIWHPSSSAQTACKPSPVLESSPVGLNGKTRTLQRFLPAVVVASALFLTKFSIRDSGWMGLREQARSGLVAQLHPPGVETSGYNPGEWGPINGFIQNTHATEKTESGRLNMLAPKCCCPAVPTLASSPHPSSSLRDRYKHAPGRTISGLHSLSHLLFEENWEIWQVKVKSVLY